MRAALKSGNAPDLAQVEYQEIPSFLLENGLVNLSPYGADKARSKFVDWQWQQGVFDEAVYAIPQASGPMGLFYRSDLYKKWGIEPPATWDEFAQAAEKIQKADPKAYISTFPMRQLRLVHRTRLAGGRQVVRREGRHLVGEHRLPADPQGRRLLGRPAHQEGDQDRTRLRQRLVQGPADRRHHLVGQCPVG